MQVAGMRASKQQNLLHQAIRDKDVEEVPAEAEEMTQKFIEEQERAAVRIQAAARGRKARTYVKSLRSDKTKEQLAEEEEGHQPPAENEDEIDHSVIATTERVMKQGEKQHQCIPSRWAGTTCTGFACLFSRSPRLIYQYCSRAGYGHKQVNWCVVTAW